jgi:hypothetical protein
MHKTTQVKVLTSGFSIDTFNQKNPDAVQNIMFNIWNDNIIVLPACISITG